MDGVLRAMHETFDVPADDQFVVIDEYEAANFRHAPSYLGVARSADLVIVQITANDTRTQAQKKALYRRTAELLAERAGVRPEDVFVNIVEVLRENGSPVFNRSETTAGIVSVRSGTLLDDPGVRPAFHAYVAFKAPWVSIVDGLPQYAQAAPTLRGTRTAG